MKQDQYLFKLSNDSNPHEYSRILSNKLII